MNSRANQLYNEVYVPQQTNIKQRHRTIMEECLVDFDDIEPGFIDFFQDLLILLSLVDYQNKEGHEDVGRFLSEKKATDMMGKYLPLFGCDYTLDMVSKALSMKQSNAGNIVRRINERLKGTKSTYCDMFGYFISLIEHPEEAKIDNQNTPGK